MPRPRSTPASTSTLSSAFTASPLGRLTTRCRALSTRPTPGSGWAHFWYGCSLLTLFPAPRPMERQDGEASLRSDMAAVRHDADAALAAMGAPPLDPSIDDLSDAIMCHAEEIEVHGGAQRFLKERLAAQRRRHALEERLAVRAQRQSLAGLLLGAVWWAGHFAGYLLVVRSLPETPRVLLLWPFIGVCPPILGLYLGERPSVDATSRRAQAALLPAQATVR